MDLLDETECILDLRRSQRNLDDILDPCPQGRAEGWYVRAALIVDVT